MTQDSGQGLRPVDPEYVAMHPYIAAMMVTEAHAVIERWKARHTECLTALAARETARSDNDRPDKSEYLLQYEADCAAYEVKMAATTAKALRDGFPPPAMQMTFRCFAFLFRFDTPLPWPEDLRGCHDLGIEPIPYGREFEAACGDHLVIASRKGDAYGGLDVSLHRISVDRSTTRLATTGNIKQDIKQAIALRDCCADPRILRGKGDVAAAVRRIWAERGGYRPSWESEIDVVRQVEAEIARRPPPAEPEQDASIDGDEAEFLCTLD